MKSGLFLVGGGARSGKSSLALRLAREAGSRRAFVATAQAFDEEMEHRISRHREERGREFLNFEAPFDLADALRDLPAVDAIVVDCLTLWLSNRMLRGDDIPLATEELIGALSTKSVDTRLIVVTNEVGFGIVPENRLAREFRDAAGTLHQQVALVADSIYACILGVALQIRPGPVREALGDEAE